MAGRKGIIVFSVYLTGNSHPKNKIRACYQHCMKSNQPDKIYPMRLLFLVLMFFSLSSSFGQTKKIIITIDSIPEQFKLTSEEPQELSKAYYELLGIGTADEYGWICEYSAMGIAPERRSAVIALIRHNRIDLLKGLFTYPNLQTKLYAIDALIYLDYNTRNKIKSAQKALKQQQVQLDRLKYLKKTDNIDSIEISVKNLNTLLQNLDAELLTVNDWKAIYSFRDSNQMIRTCGNTGSYRIYQTSTTELLSDKAIAEISKNYEALKRLGYLR